MKISKHTALVVLDVQKAIDLPVWGIRNNPDAELNMQSLLENWRRAERAVFHIRHDSVEEGSGYRPDAPTHAFKDEVLPIDGETIIGKSVNSAFVGNSFVQLLCAKEIEHIVLFGVKTNNSVETSVRHASNLGFKISLVEDACFTHNQRDWNGIERSADDVHAMSLSNLSGEYCEIVTTQQVLAALKLA